jgi:hypothetical protein
MKRILTLIAVSAAISTAAGAQDTRSDAVACMDSVVTGLYRRCALWIEGNRVRRGESGAVVGRPGFFRPIRMTQIVAGDSALAYARTYERRTRQSTTLLFIGGALLASAYAVLDSRACTSTIVDPCDHWDNGDWIAGSLAVGGLALSIPGLVLQVKGQRAGAQAVWWNNERFAR